MTQSRIWSVAAAARGTRRFRRCRPWPRTAPRCLGAPHDKGIGLQAPATALAEKMDFLHNWILMPIITIITLFVLGLLFYRDGPLPRIQANPVPSKTTHNTVLEVAWTVVPVLILVFIAVFSFPLLYQQLEIPTPDLTIKAIGHQWYWSYEYPDNGNFTFEHAWCRKEDLQPGQLRLLDTDNEVVLPIDTNIRIQITGADVIHAWAMPAFGVKHDAVPGRTNETWFNIKKPGIYYGQCSELCGVDHAYMPIKVARGHQGRVRRLGDRGAAEVRQGRRDSRRRRPTPRRRRRRSKQQNSPQGIAAMSPVTTSHSGLRSRRSRRPQARLLRALVLFDQPQGHRHAVPDLRDHRRPDRRRLLGLHAHGAAGAGHPVFRHRRRARRPALERGHHRARPDHDLLHGHAGDDRRLRQLVRAADDRRARHGLPAHEQHQLLAADPVASSCWSARPSSTAAPAPAGRSIRRCRDERPSRAAARSTWRSSRCTWRAPPRSSAPSTSSPPSSTCARRA